LLGTAGDSGWQREMTPMLGDKYKIAEGVLLGYLEVMFLTLLPYPVADSLNVLRICPAAAANQSSAGFVPVLSAAAVAFSRGYGMPGLIRRVVHLA
jgi:hypothetical protein